MDEHYYKVRFTPREARSAWSQVNRERVERLIAGGRMRPKGLAEVPRAKADRRWDAAYAASRLRKIGRFGSVNGSFRRLIWALSVDFADFGCVDGPKS